jgi:hypothetical protein
MNTGTVPPTLNLLFISITFGEKIVLVDYDSGLIAIWSVRQQTDFNEDRKRGPLAEYIKAPFRNFFPLPGPD